MSPTRRPGVVDIFQDPRHPFESDYSLDQSLVSALQPTRPDIANQNVVLAPTAHGLNSTSPAKRPSPKAAKMQSRLYLDETYFPAPQPAPHGTDSPPKKPVSAMSFHIGQAPKPQMAHFSTFTTADKENAYPTFNRNLMPKSEPLAPPTFHGVRGYPGKHPLSDSTPIERNPKKQKLEEPEEHIALPEPEDMPMFEDDGSKPNYSYATLIGMAILRAPDRRLTLSQIYKWISDTFSFYQTAEPGWMNSIRHNLSLNKAFYKQERPRNDPGKGMYWHITEGMEKQFLRDKPVRPVPSKGRAFMPSESSDILQAVASSSCTGPSSQIKPTRTIDSSTFPNETEISSDATVAASDAGQQDEQALPAVTSATAALRSSPPPPEIHSSPPVARDAPSRGTPPPLGRFPSHSRSGSRNKRVDNFRDSGFYSSINSSAIRGQPADANFLTSDVDIERPLIKHGRAEDEIARMRGSSYDPSPSKPKTKFSKPATFFQSSSPLRHESSIFPPLTPSVSLNPPPKPAPAVSPNTYLRQHRETIRELIGTPGQSLATAVNDDLSWTPAFTIHDDNKSHPSTASHLPSEDGNLSSPELPQSRHEDFDNISTFDDILFNDLFNRDSPIKKSSVKRPGLQRFATAGARVLGDVTESRQNSRLASPIRLMQPSTKKESLSSLSPQKQDRIAVYEETVMDSLKEHDILDLDPSSESDKLGMDLTQGFKKIGEKEDRENEQFGHFKSGPKRPALGRSMTNAF